MAYTKGYIKRSTDGTVKQFQFNPENFSYSRSVSFSDVESPGMPYPCYGFVGGGTIEFDLELFLWKHPRDTTTTISSWETFLKSLIPPEKNSTTYKVPPTFTVAMGKNNVRTCVATGLDVSYDRLDPTLNPVEATFTLKCRQI